MAKGTPDQQNRINSTGRSTDAARQQTNKKNSLHDIKDWQREHLIHKGSIPFGRSVDVARKANTDVSKFG